MTTYLGNGWENEYGLNLSININKLNEAIACALIAVDEILDAIDWHDFQTPNLQMWFWDAVKKEIELL